MEITLSLILGYLLGTLSPAAYFGKRKHVNLKETGTKNLGASNATIVLGRSYGAIVMAVDILKAYFAGKIAKWLFPHLVVEGYLAGFAAILGHVFPFYMHFQGGKGLAAFGGMVCFHSPWLLLFYLTVGVALMLLVNYSVFLPLFGAVTFPIIVLVQTGDMGIFLVSLAAGILVAWRHWENIGKIRRGEETPVRQVFATKVFKNK